jgi:hypothetical protein
MSMSDSAPAKFVGMANKFAPWLLLALISFVYANSLRVPFIFDDRFAVVRNESIRDLGDWPRVLLPDAYTAGAAGRPVVNLTFAINYALHGLDVRGYHVGNILVHFASCLVLWGLLRRILQLFPELVRQQHREAIALILTALWAAHPLLTISVTVVQQRTELLVGLFILFTLYALTRAHQSAGRRRIWLSVSVISCGFAMGSKEVAVGLPLLAFLFDRAFLSGSFARAWRGGRVYYLALAATWIVLWLAMGSSGQRNNTAGFGLGVSSWHYLLTQCEALVLYVRLCFWPAPLVYDYGTPIIQDWTEVWWQGLLVLAALGASGFALVRHPRVGFVAALFFAVLAPSSSIVPVVTQTMGEQRMYLPSIVIVVLFGITGYRFLGAKILFILALGACAGAVGSHLRVRAYSTEERIWVDVTQKLPGSPRGYANLLYVMIEQGRDEEASAALPDFVRRLGIHHDSKEPFDADAHTAQLMALMGSAYVDVGKIDMALDLYRRAAVLEPKNQLAHFNSAKLLFDLKRHAEAMPYLDAFLVFKPDDTEALQMFGRCLMLTGQPAKAETVLAHLIRLAPRNLEAHLDHADAVILQENYVEGMRLYRELHRLNPDHPRVRERLAQLAPMLAPGGVP